MVQTIKSVLLFGYDSIYHSLSERAQGVGDLLGARTGIWLEAIESGDIRRRFQAKRCHANRRRWARIGAG